ncbi:MAG: hypothetical protein ACOWWR_18585 [Eubacteriales bacterium]
MDCYAKKPSGILYSIPLLALKADIITHISRIGIYPQNYFLHLDIYQGGTNHYWVKYKKEKQPKYFYTLDDALDYIHDKKN